MFDNAAFEIVKSTKAGLASDESLLVVRNGTSYLRILGQEPLWELMTATASEDDGCAKVCGDTRRLIETAIRLCLALGFNAHETRDRLGRDYVKICRIVRERDDEDLRDVLFRTVERFFDLFDRPSERVAGGEDDLANLYEAISPDGDGEDVYLSDGVWLSSDGTLRERGR